MDRVVKDILDRNGIKDENLANALVELATYISKHPDVNVIRRKISQAETNERRLSGFR